MNAFVARAVFPLALLMAAALFVKSHADVGGGFMAGATAGLGALLQYACLDHASASRCVGARHAVRLIIAGTFLGVAVVVWPTLFGLPPVTHAPGPFAPAFETGTLVLRTTTLFELAVALQVYGGMVCTFDRVLPLLKGAA